MPERPRVALLHYTSRNLGDDIQAFAVKSFIDADCSLDRDELPHDGPACDLLLFGWLLQSRRWPPSAKLRPHAVSIHVTPGARGLIAEHIDWWRPLGTISCRDTSTAAFFLSHDIPAHFDGCVSLSLRRWLEPEAGCAVLVDVDTAPCGKPSLEYERIVRKTHKIPRNKAADQEYRLAAVRDVLAAYQQAELVVTSRLHAMLPCLAFGTPVVYVPSRDLRQENVFARLLDYLPYVEVWDGRTAYKSGDPPVNHQPTALIHRVGEQLLSLRERLSPD